MGTGWLAVIMEYEGLVVEDYSDLHQRAWESLSAEEGKPLPPGWMFKRAEGMKNEQVRNPAQHDFEASSCSNLFHCSSREVPGEAGLSMKNKK